MQLILRVQSYSGQVPDNTRERTFERFPIILGRSTSCDYVLDDLSKYISSNHATVTNQGDQLIIEDTSSNGVYINGSPSPLGRNQTSTIKHGDVLTIGDYLIQVAVTVAASGPVDAFSMDNPAQPEEKAYDPWNGNEPVFETQNDPMAQGTDGLDDLFGEVGENKSDPLISSEQSAATEDEDWFDFAKTGQQQAVPAPTSPELQNPAATENSSLPTADPDKQEVDPFDWLTGDGDADSTSDDQLGTTMDGHAPITGAGAVQLNDQPNPDFADPFSDLTDQADPVPQEEPTVRRTSESQPPSPSQPAPAPNPAQQQSPQPRPVQPAPVQQAPISHQAAPPQPSPAPPQGQVPAGGSGLTTVLQAAGLNPADYSHLNEQQTLHQIGTLLGQSIEGIMLLLQSRGEMKNAIRSDVTMLGSRNNNPLKFSYGSTEALGKLLLDANNPGYLNSDEAITQAVDDLKIHQVAMLEAMRSAVRAMLAQFDPKRLEQKLQKDSPLAANIPIRREAKLWQLFQDKFSDIHEEAVTDFGQMFGEEFRKAYEKRLGELGRKPDF